MYSKIIIDILGWTGSILYLVAYALEAYATTGLNAVWIVIGLFTLGRKWLTRS
ncbi:MAG: hypothetical protein JW730_09610 [Anaerolineales bacterium]|nr:hypothetical protein [Anaerolineales bacterium]